MVDPETVVQRLVQLQWEPMDRIFGTRHVLPMHTVPGGGRRAVLGLPQPLERLVASFSSSADLNDLALTSKSGMFLVGDVLIAATHCTTSLFVLN